MFCTITNSRYPYAFKQTVLLYNLHVMHMSGYDIYGKKIHAGWEPIQEFSKGEQNEYRAKIATMQHTRDLQKQRLRPSEDEVRNISQFARNYPEEYKGMMDRKASRSQIATRAGVLAAQDWERATTARPSAGYEQRMKELNKRMDREDRLRAGDRSGSPYTPPANPEATVMGDTFVGDEVPVKDSTLEGLLKSMYTDLDNAQYDADKTTNQHLQHLTSLIRDRDSVTKPFDRALIDAKRFVENYSGDGDGVGADANMGALIAQRDEMDKGAREGRDWQTNALDTPRTWAQYLRGQGGGSSRRKVRKRRRKRRTLRRRRKRKTNKRRKGRRRTRRS